MPLYEYRCTKCGFRFEKIQSFSAEPERECPKCQGELIRPLTAPAFQFKGAGWYVNDYASKSSTSSEFAPESKSGAADDAKKPAPATESKSTTSPAPAPAAAPASNPAAKSDSAG